MKTIFWTIISAILVLSIVSLALYSGVEEVVTEPLPEDIAAMIGDLRGTVDDMDVMSANKNEISKIALAAGNTGWFNEAEENQTNLMTLYNSKVLTLQQQLISSGLSESAQKQVDEFIARADGLVSVDSQKELLAAKKAVGLRVTNRDWMDIADKYKNIEDTFNRNMGLRALGETVAELDSRLADTIYDMLDSPYVIAMHTINNSTNVEITSLLNGIDDAYLRLQVLIAYGKKNLDGNAINLIKDELGNFADRNEKAFQASTVLVKLPGIPEADRASFYTLIEAADTPQLLLADTKMSLIEKQGVKDTDADRYFSEVTELLPEIIQNYPRERIKARLAIIQSKKATVDEIIQLADELVSVTLREKILTFAACKRNDLAEDDLNRLTDAMHDPYSILISKMDRFNELEITGKEAADYLAPLAGLTEEIDELRPHINVTVAWAKVDPFLMRQNLNEYGTADKVAAAAAVTDVLTDNAVSELILDDILTEINASTQFEPIEKAQLLRKLGATMLKVDRRKAMTVLEEAFRTLTMN